jgi:competence protein ComEA
MKKQILILVSVVVIAIVFFLSTRNSSSNSETLFEVEESVLESDGIVYKSDVLVIEPEENVPDLNGMVFVDVQGEVVNPGVFEVNDDVRVGHLINLAGGLTDHAFVNGLNQAARIYDEMVIFVPHVNDVSEVMDGITANDERIANTDESGLISLNTASALELQSLPGIGATLSANIIAHREENGVFSTIDELVNVDGIGISTVENIREFVKP